MATPLRKDFSNDAEFNKALEAHLAAETQTENKSTKAMPQKVELEGLITNVSDKIERNGSTFRFITVGKHDAVLVAEAIFTKNQAKLAEGVNVLLTAEQRIEYKTGYIDKDTKKWTPHKASGLSYVSVALSNSEKFADADAKAKRTVDSVTNVAKSISSIITEADAGAQNALAIAMAGAFAALKG